ncbi:hypothetical protein [Stappia sp. P2PMeth1]|uniref:hypothetical protein n=1 Tax=Stappia sp. P2PMeth1 TaxID=2003586 RepID=UPI001647046B|nr:hypothetical protein [Stappia sp. P2PMeth1]
MKSIVFESNPETHGNQRVTLKELGPKMRKARGGRKPPACRYDTTGQVPGSGVGYVSVKGMQKIPKQWRNP